MKGQSKAGEETYAKRVASLLNVALDYYVANDKVLARIKTYLKDRLEFEIGEFRNKKEALQSKDWKNKVKVTAGNFQTQCERMDSFINAQSSLTDASNKMELPDEILEVQRRILEDEGSSTLAASTSDTPVDLDAETREAGELLITADLTLKEAADEWLEFFMEQRVNYLNKEKLGSLIQPRKYDRDDTPGTRWYDSGQKILSWVDFVLKYASPSLKDDYVHFAKGDGDKERAAADMKTVAHDYLYLRQANQQERTSIFAGFNRVSEQLGDIPKPLKMRLFDKWWSNAERIGSRRITDGMSPQHLARCYPPSAVLRCRSHAQQRSWVESSLKLKNMVVARHGLLSLQRQSSNPIRCHRMGTVFTTCLEILCSRMPKISASCTKSTSNAQHKIQKTRK